MVPLVTALHTSSAIAFSFRGTITSNTGTTARVVMARLHGFPEALLPTRAMRATVFVVTGPRTPPALDGVKSTDPFLAHSTRHSTIGARAHDGISPVLEAHSWRQRRLARFTRRTAAIAWARAMSSTPGRSTWSATTKL